MKTQKNKMLTTEVTEMKFLSTILCVLCGLIFFLVSMSNATVMVKYSVSDLVSKSDNIIMGKVTKKKSEWNLNKTQIYTYVTIEITKEIKGVSGVNAITIKELGGEVGDMGMKVQGGPEYQENEDVVVFLNKIDDKYQTVGMLQGKYNIIQDKVTGTKKIINQADYKGVMLMKSDGTQAGTDTSNAMELDKFLEMINLSLSK